MSDSLLIVTVIKGLPVEFTPFTAFIEQKDKILTFSEFKVGLGGVAETKIIKEKKRLIM